MASIDKIIEYEQMIKRLTNIAIEELHASHGNRDAVRAACCRYFKRGYEAKFTTGELVDFFGVCGTVCEDAGFTEAESVEVMKVIGELTDEEIASTQV